MIWVYLTFIHTVMHYINYTLSLSKFFLFQVSAQLLTSFLWRRWILRFLCKCLINVTVYSLYNEPLKAYGILYRVTYYSSYFTTCWWLITDNPRPQLIRMNRTKPITIDKFLVRNRITQFCKTVCAHVHSTTYFTNRKIESSFLYVG